MPDPPQASPAHRNGNGIELPYTVKLALAMFERLGLGMLLLAVLLGWIPSALTKDQGETLKPVIAPLIAAVSASAAAVAAHESNEAAFRVALMNHLKQQRCLTSLPRETQPDAALSDRDACEYLAIWRSRVERDRDRDRPPPSQPPAFTPARRDRSP